MITPMKVGLGNVVVSALMFGDAFVEVDLDGGRVGRNKTGGGVVTFASLGAISNH